MTEIECSICLCEYSFKGDHIPLKLECGHAYGKLCLKAYMASRTHRSLCPQCRHEIRGRFDELEPDYVLIAGLEAVADDHIMLGTCGVASSDAGKVSVSHCIS